MPISIDRSDALDLTVFTATGTVTFDEQMDVLRTFYGGAPTANVIWDFTGADDVGLASGELREIVRYTREHTARRRGGRTALVVDSPLKYGLARMATAFADLEDVPWEMTVFEDLATARAWAAGDA